MYYNIKVCLNISSNKKKDFIGDLLIPFCRGTVKEDYYFSRNIEISPVVNIYIRTSKEKATYYYSEFNKIFETFVFSLSEEERKSDELYYQKQSDIRKVNGLRKLEDRDNLSVEFYELDRIERHGDYTYPQEKELYTEYFFKTQRTMEDSFLYMKEKGKAAELITIMCLFQVTSQQLDQTGIGRGYLSFKSHLLGFLSYKHKDIDNYKQVFEEHYKALKKTLIDVSKILENRILLEEQAKANRLFHILYDWDKHFIQLYASLLALQGKKAKISFIKKIRLMIAHHNFRRMSSFHNEAFHHKNKGFFKKEQFRAYRMLVNFVYLLLPNMGLSSSKRVEGSYLLVRTMEGDE